MNDTPRKRLFTKARRRRRIGFLHLAAALTLLVACTPRTENWSPAESQKHNVVNWAEFQHAVAFPAGSDEIEPAERAALDQFLGRNASGEGVRISLASTASGDDTLAMRREVAVSAYLRSRGLRPQLGAAPASASGDGVRVSVGRYVVTPPSCPDWSKPSGSDPGNTVSSNFGCATTANLGLMIADPGALIRGYSPGPGDGESLAKGVQNYRENKTPWLPVTAGAQLGGTTGGAAGGAGN